MESMDISKGFQIESPNILVPWGITQRRLRQLFADYPIRRVGEGYYVTSCVSLNGLSHELGFHFTPRFPWTLHIRGRLEWLEFFRRHDNTKVYMNDLRESFETFQKHLELTFGPPSKSSPGSEGFPIHEWCLGSVEVGHSIYERFTLNEAVMIRKCII